MNKIKARPKFKSFASSASILGIVACSTGPYISPAVPRPGLVPVKAPSAWVNNTAVQFVPGTTNPKTVHISINEAAAYARFVQDAYQGALQRRSIGRSALNSATLLTTITALGLGATNTGGDTALITGLTGSLLGISGQFLVSRDHEAAYSLGGKALGCVISAATDARVTTTQLHQLKFAITSARAQHLVAQKQLDENVKVVEAAITAGTAGAPTRAELVTYKATEDTRLANAGRTIQYASSLLQSADILGEQLFNRVEEIRWEVNDAVRRSQPDLLALDRNLRSLVSAQLGASGQQIPNGASSSVPSTNAPPTALSGMKILVGATDPLQAAMDSLKDALARSEGVKPISFTATLFDSCSLNGISNISTIPPIALSSSMVTVNASDGLDEAFAVSGGRAPYTATSAFSKLEIVDFPRFCGRLKASRF